MTKKILVIDDDSDLRKLIETILKPFDMTVFHACSGPEGLKQAYQIHPDLIILDIMMPGLDGFDVCMRLREMSNMPVLMLTARGNGSDVMHGFNVGADDYIRKPFSKDELVARINALLRRSSRRHEADASLITHYTDKVLNIDLEAQCVKVNNKRIDLSPTEYRLLACLVRNTGRMVPHRQVMNEVWGSTYGEPSSELTLYVFYLRKKLEDRKHGHHYIHTQWGRGYWFMPSDEELTK